MPELTLLQKRQLEINAGRGAGSVADDLAKQMDAAVGQKDLAEDHVVNLQGQLVAANADGATFRTFVHQVAGANTILPDGKKLTFAGRTGANYGFGYYMTDIEIEIDWLAALAKIPSSQVTELVSDPVTHTERLVPKKVDPTISLAVADAAKNTEAVFNPATSAAVDNLGKSIAASAAAAPMQTQ